MSSRERVIRAFRTLDCAKKVRIHYELPEPAGQALYALFPHAELCIQRFSQHVAGAKDHFTLVRPRRFRAAGVVGEPRLVVTFGKPDARWPGEEIAEFERALGALGRVEHAA